MAQRRLFRFKSIHTSMALAFSCLIVGITALLTYNSYRLSASAATGNAKIYTGQLTQQVNANIQTYLDTMASISALAGSGEELEKLASLPDPQSEEGARKAASISRFFRSVVRSREDISTILFVGSNGAVVSDRAEAKFKPLDDITAQEWYRGARDSGGKVAISSSHVQHVYKREYPWVVSISRMLGRPGEAGSGVLMVDLNLNVINNLCRQIQLGQRGYVFILDPAGDLIYHPQQQLLYSRLKSEDIPSLLNSKTGLLTKGKGRDLRLYTIGTNDYGWKVVGVTYPDELVGNKGEIRNTSLLAGGLFLAVGLALSVLLSYRLANPIKRLEHLMKKVEKGDFNIRVDVESTDEIGKLSRSFNLMIGKIKDLMEQIVEEQEQKRISELKAMQAQIQPHFLYNTLDSIIWMGEMGKMQDVVRMTTALAKLFRASISKGDELVPVGTELEHIRSYLTIQHIRYKNKFTYEIELDPDILSCLTLKLVLQPLVENAIYHGLKQQAIIGHIRITGRKHDGEIELRVSDDGAGMTEGQVRELTAKLRSGEDGPGVGLPNVNQRIRLTFGEPYGLEIESEPEEGTTVILRFPEIPGEGAA
ncbi:HAMP domain-containing protein [Cohnella sp. CFH 77786]|uniref:cache domain-containing sensor histidine kinase n=1 Tax=Cohnella sp. CFH 77786 TaxID=2662265 RepID=UPI001C60A028|nr:sensor histidine kinase [Cohnella sp. CFH 77786]MBW5447801.1 HAMP domain-containing protein [Cohnella sp. CFH 77786]